MDAEQARIANSRYGGMLCTGVVEQSAIKLPRQLSVQLREDCGAAHGHFNDCLIRRVAPQSRAKHRSSRTRGLARVGRTRQPDPSVVPARARPRSGAG